MQLPVLSPLCILLHFMWIFFQSNQLKLSHIQFFNASVRTCLCSSSSVWKYRSDYIVHQRLEGLHQPAGLMFDRVIRKLSSPVITGAHLLGRLSPALPDACVCGWWECSPCVRVEACGYEWKSGWNVACEGRWAWWMEALWGSKIWAISFSTGGHFFVLKLRNNYIFDSFCLSSRLINLTSGTWALDSTCGVFVLHAGL